jgi:tetratricopeptide (TPR) repeat protein
MMGESNQPQSFEWESNESSHNDFDSKDEQQMQLARTHNDRAKVLYEAEKYADAEAEVRKALEYAPNWPALHDNLGTICAELGNFSDALTHYVQALRLDPKRPEVLYNLGYFLLQNGLDTAHYFLEKTLEIDPEYPDAWRVMGDIHMERGEISKAISSLGKAIQKKTTDSRARFRLSDIFWEQGDYHESAQQLEEILRLDSNDQIAWHNLGLAAIMLEEGERAENALLRAIEIDSAYLLAHYHLTCYYAENFRVADALNHLAKACELDLETVREWAREDDKLDHLRGNPRFDNILNGHI